jgi:addiction module RelB/DinJ family antitoxin
MYMKTIINIKADKEIKKKAQKIANELGLSLSTVINAYLRQFIRNKAVYYGMAPTMTSELEEVIREVEEDLEKGKNISRSISSKKELKDHFSSL